MRRRINESELGKYFEAVFRWLNVSVDKEWRGKI